MSGQRRREASSPGLLLIGANWIGMYRQDNAGKLRRRLVRLGTSRHGTAGTERHVVVDMLRRGGARQAR